MSWYDSNIEEGVRAVVRLLRGNGINTTYSCHHSMVIEAENYLDGEANKIYDLLIEHGFDGFTIEVALYKECGQFLRRSLRLQFHERSLALRNLSNNNVSYPISRAVCG